MADLVARYAVRRLVPGAGAAVGDVPVIVRGVEVGRRMPAAVAPLVEDRVEATIGATELAIRRLGIAPGPGHERGNPGRRLAAGDIVVEVDGHVVVEVHEFDDPVVVEPM